MNKSFFVTCLNEGPVSSSLLAGQDTLREATTPAEIVVVATSATSATCASLRESRGTETKATGTPEAAAPAEAPSALLNS